MFWPVTASIATTLAAFLPLMFWPGVSGKFMRFLPVTVFTVLSGSLLYALVFGPAIGAIFGRAGNVDRKAQKTLDVLQNGDTHLVVTHWCVCSGVGRRNTLWITHYGRNCCNPDDYVLGLRSVRWRPHLFLSS